MSEAREDAESLRDILKERAALYINTMKEALSYVKAQAAHLDEHERRLVDIAEMYLRDSLYYYEKGDLLTSLATVSYAEGLLDSLNITNRLKIDWKKSRPKKVLVAGTFDLIHPGHVKLFEEASRLGDLYVIVSRSENAEKAKKRPTIMPEDTRLYLVNSIRYVKKAVLGDKTDILKVVVEIAPDIIVLGPDQDVDEKWLKDELSKRGLKSTEVIRVKERYRELSPSSTTEILKNILKMFCSE